MYSAGTFETLLFRIHQLVTSSSDLNSFVSEAESYIDDEGVSYNWREKVKKEVNKKYNILLINSYMQELTSGVDTLTFTADSVLITADSVNITI